MKIFIIIQCANLGGMERVTLSAAELLKKQGHEISILSLQPLNGLEKPCRESGIPIRALSHYRGASGILNAGEIRKAIRQYAPDRVWVVGHNIGAVIAAKFSGRYTALSIHYHHGESPLWKWRLFYAIARRCCRKIHFVSQYIFDEIQKLFPATEKVRVFPNYFAMPPEPVRDINCRLRLGLPPDAVVVGNAGWLIPRKAFDVFLKTAAEVVRQRSDVYFLIAGDGPEREALQNLTRQLHLEKQVLFAGWLQEMSDFWNGVDLILFNTRFDALGSTPQEALLRNLPVVASLEHCGLLALLDDSPCCRIFTRHDPKALAAAVLEILAMPENEKKAALQKARQQVINFSSAEAYLKNVTELLEL